VTWHLSQQRVTQSTTPRTGSCALAEVCKRGEWFGSGDRRGNRHPLGKRDQPFNCALRLVATQVGQLRTLAVVGRSGVVVPQVAELAQQLARSLG
jgi:hypothetical protein